MTVEIEPRMTTWVKVITGAAREKIANSQFFHGPPPERSNSDLFIEDWGAFGTKEQIIDGLISPDQNNGSRYPFILVGNEVRPSGNFVTVLKALDLELRFRTKDEAGLDKGPMPGMVGTETVGVHIKKGHTLIDRLFNASSARHYLSKVFMHIGWDGHELEEAVNGDESLLSKDGKNGINKYLQHEKKDLLKFLQTVSPLVRHIIPLSVPDAVRKRKIVANLVGLFDHNSLVPADCPFALETISLRIMDLVIGNETWLTDPARNLEKLDGKGAQKQAERVGKRFNQMVNKAVELNMPKALLGDMERIFILPQIERYKEFGVNIDYNPKVEVNTKT